MWLNQQAFPQRGSTKFSRANVGAPPGPLKAIRRNRLGARCRRQHDPRPHRRPVPSIAAEPIPPALHAPTRSTRSPTLSLSIPGLPKSQGQNHPNLAIKAGSGQTVRWKTDHSPQGAKSICSRHASSARLKRRQRNDPVVMPSIKYRCAKANKSTLGTSATTTPARTTETLPVPRFPCSPTRPRGRV